MAILTWQTAAGNLGSYTAGSVISTQFIALSDSTSSVITYKLLSGTFPAGTKTDPLELSLPGYLTGTLDSVTEQKTYVFTIRAFDQYGNIRDRTFEITVVVAQVAALTATSGRLLTTYDSTWVNFNIEYENSVPSNVVTITHTSGQLPPGLYITPTGVINGYAESPESATGSPISKVYIFTIQLQSALGNDSKQYSIEVLNQQFIKPPHNRVPAICNSKPLSLQIDNDPYYRYYLQPDNVINTINANEYFTFKVIGHDFENDVLRYSFGKLPPGLTGDTETGWITGIPVMSSTGIGDFIINVSVSKLNKPLVTTPKETFHLRIVNNIVDDIEWVTNENLGVIYNNTVCELTVEATSTKTLLYSLVSGRLPANLTLENSGSISGRVAFQPDSTLLAAGDETDFTFVVQTYAEEYPTLRKYKTFTLTVKQHYDDPVETVYFKISPSLQGRAVLQSLLTDTSLIPTSYLYRPDDIYFGKSSDIKIVQAYGLTVSPLSTYLSAIEKNHYTRNVVLGEIKTAIARNEAGDIDYEVVYVDISDDLTIDGTSIPSQLTWVRDISLNKGPWTINKTDIYSSYAFNDAYYASLSPGSVKTLYPGSLENMRAELVSKITQNTDSNLLPRWMTSQQENGNTLGFVRCWVICYTLPGYASTVKSNIENNWEYSTNDIDCTIDRYYVDRSATYNWNINLLIPAWEEIPSEVPNSTNPEQHDMVVLFPRKTILPK